MFSPIVEGPNEKECNKGVAMYTFTKVLLGSHMKKSTKMKYVPARDDLDVFLGCIGLAVELEWCSQNGLRSRTLVVNFC